MRVMNKIRVIDEIGGDFAVTTDDGDKIFIMLDENFQKGIITTLDFSGVIILTTAFLNAAIGQLYSKYTGEEISPMLKLVNVAEEDKILFKKVADRAKEYFANKDSFEENSDESIYGRD